MTAPASEARGAVEPYLDRAISGDSPAAVRMALDMLDHGVPEDGIIVDMLAGAQHEAGERWWANLWTVADEHLITGVTQRTLDAVANSMQQPMESGLVVVACAEGDWHSLPAQMCAELLRNNGFDVLFLGASTPAEHVGRLMERQRPDGLALTCNLPCFFPGVTRLANVAHQLGVPVIVGGRALGSDDRRALGLGADAWAPSVFGALPILRGWATSPPVVSTAAVSLDPIALELDARSATLAAAAFHDLKRDLPVMRTYRADQLDRTLEDLAYILRFAAAARMVTDPRVLAEFLAWLDGLLAARGVPAAAVPAGLVALIRVTEEDYPSVATDLTVALDALAGTRSATG